MAERSSIAGCSMNLRRACLLDLKVVIDPLAKCDSTPPPPHNRIGRRGWPKKKGEGGGWLASIFDKSKTPRSNSGSTYLHGIMGKMSPKGKGIQSFIASFSWAKLRLSRYGILDGRSND
jgi:hypothetical protein